jgi:hypothetical protein
VIAPSRKEKRGSDEEEEKRLTQRRRRGLESRRPEQPSLTGANCSGRVVSCNSTMRKAVRLNLAAFCPNHYTELRWQEDRSANLTFGPRCRTTRPYWHESRSIKPESTRSCHVNDHRSLWRGVVNYILTIVLSINSALYG